MGAQMQMPRCLVISEATQPIRRMLMSRCSFREAELAGEILPHEVAIEDCDRAAAEFEELGEEHVGDRALAGAAEAGEEHGEALPGSGRMAAAELFHHFIIGEPVGDLGAAGQAVAEFSATDVERFLALGDFVDGIVRLFVGDIDHEFEVDHFDAELFLVLLHKLLGVVGAVKRLAAFVAAGTGVIAADDEVRAAMVLADDRVPDGFARTAHAHGQRQQRQVRSVLRVVGHERLVAADARVVIDVARLRHADDRVDEEVGFFILRGAEGELVMCAVHRIAGLESNDLPPTALGELFAQLGGGFAERLVVVVQRRLQALEAAADVNRLALVH